MTTDTPGPGSAGGEPGLVVDRRTGELHDTSTPAGLAGIAAAHQHTLDQLGSDVERLAAAVADSLEALRGEIDAVAASSANGVDGATWWNWRAIGFVGADLLWQQLTGWVGWLRGRYPLAKQVPGCWWRHPELVEELTALHLAWKAAYTDPDASLTGPADWHDRWLPAAVHRFTHTWHACPDGDHRDRTPGLYATPDPPRGVDRPGAPSEPPPAASDPASGAVSGPAGGVAAQVPQEVAQAVDDPAAWGAHVTADVNTRRPPPPPTNAAQSPSEAAATSTSPTSSATDNSAGPDDSANPDDSAGPDDGEETPR